MMKQFLMAGTIKKADVSKGDKVYAASMTNGVGAQKWCVKQWQLCLGKVDFG